MQGKVSYFLQVVKLYLSTKVLNTIFREIFDKLRLKHEIFYAFLWVTIALDCYTMSRVIVV